MILAAGLFLVGTVCPAGAYQAIGGPTELLYYDAANAYNGYTLFPAGGQTILIDMQGNVINTWPGGANPRLAPPNYNLLDRAQTLTERDWDGNIVWSYTEARSNYAVHHDCVRGYNPKLKAYTTFYIANKDISVADGQAKGATTVAAGAQMDCFVEVDMNGNRVWEWCFEDHLIQDVYPTRQNYAGVGKTVANYPGRLDINLPGRALKADWLHINSIDYNSQLDQVIGNTVQGESYVIDHGNTFVVGSLAASVALAAGPAGDFLYRLGDPARYKQGNAPSILTDWTTSSPGHKQFGGSHHIHWVANDLLINAQDVDPAKITANHNLLIHNNDQYMWECTPQSYAQEYNPYLNSAGVDTGHYVNPPDAGYAVWTDSNSKSTHKQSKNISKQEVWRWGSDSSTGFFNWIGGGAQRLPNGNTLNCGDVEGHLVEVTAAGKVVWEYINPVSKRAIVTELRNNIPQDNAVFRAVRYGPGYPGFVGRDMRAIKGTVTTPVTYYGFGYASGSAGSGISAGGATAVGGAGAGY